MVIVVIKFDSLALLDDFLSDSLAVVEEAVVGQSVLEHVDLPRPLEYSLIFLMMRPLEDSLIC